MSTQEEEIEALAEASKTIGPKMVRTKDVTITTHDPIQILKAKNMVRPNKRILFGDFPSTVVSPMCKDHCTCKEEDCE